MLVNMQADWLKEQIVKMNMYYKALINQAEYNGMFSPLWEQASDLLTEIKEMEEELVRLEEGEIE